MAEHQHADERLISDHSADLNYLKGKVNTLRAEQPKYMPWKAGITFFLSVLVTLTVAFLAQSQIQSNTFLEIRRQDQADLTAYKLAQGKRISKNVSDMIEVKGNIRHLGEDHKDLKLEVHAHQRGGMHKRKGGL